MHDRSAGILLHISSLPGSPYIGDIGAPAKSFAKFLHNSYQSVWQMLPVQPVSSDQSFSPYSSHSAFAGNPLFISMDDLVKKGLLKKSDLATQSADTDRTDYQSAIEYKSMLLEKAFRQWLKQGGDRDPAFKKYCKNEDHWLGDFALYSAIKSLRNKEPWYEWPKELKTRNKAALARVAADKEEELKKIKWVQMVFDGQWRELKTHCESLQIRLFGDMPIYVAHDSADVWSHPDIFTIDKNGMLTNVAGVPPDLFNANGQLWGMPLFNWRRLQTRRYDWWVDRIRRNFNWFHMLRLDHFRAFSSYWSVKAGAKTAKNGKWVRGPGRLVFDEVRKQLGDISLVAEDLGEIDDAVYELRDNLGLPGMNVLQFAFGDVPASPYLPHNHITNSVVYTGTHDNNTTIGWFDEAGPADRKSLEGYLGTNVNRKNVGEILCRLAHQSVGRLTILPMQDVLFLDGSARMNMPASTNENWTWRLREKQLDESTVKRLQNWTTVYGRKL